ncbi:hypothetical protein [Cedecea sp. NFIX57]|uniref:hypothetical protein n=1 Tax=Cedecea sp. NFIX57 TaxID=1566286 RepID=UPI000A0B7062|nr:hypothetical protein [Cedecea sp. NFIX57]SMG59779.1 hypothetical protein SAMN03159353_103219 [Cedecea sp. NFIX57]
MTEKRHNTERYGLLAIAAVLMTGLIVHGNQQPRDMLQRFDPLNGQLAALNNTAQVGRVSLAARAQHAARAGVLLEKLSRTSLMRQAEHDASAAAMRAAPAPAK